MSKKVTVKMSPKIEIINNLPDVFPPANWVISYVTHLEIEGEFVFKFKTTMLVRGLNNPNDTFLDVKYSYQVGVNFGFFSPETKDDFYNVSNYCYQTSVIEFNKTLDSLQTTERGPFMDARFISFEEVKEMVENALNPSLN